jgi:hypothetical protein
MVKHPKKARPAERPPDEFEPIDILPGGVTAVEAEYDERLGEVLRPLTQDYRRADDAGDSDLNPTPNRMRAKPGRKARYEPELKSALKQIQLQRPDLFNSSADALAKEIRRAWQPQARKSKLPDSRSALNDAIERVRKEIEAEV